ncbi:MAG: hypothetical protein AAGI91_15130 [Bacteroidota bacterium]
MGQYAVILTISAILLGGVLLYNARAATSDASAALGAYQTDRVAREASQIALRDAVRRLNDRPDDWTDVLSTAQARFNVRDVVYEMGGGISVTYSDSLTEMYLGDPADPSDPDRVRLRVKGAFDSWNETTQSVEPTDFVVEAVYQRRWVDVNVPGGFRKAVWSAQDLTVGGTAEILGDLHTNGTLGSSTSTFAVYGTGTYTGSTSADASLFSGDPAVGRRDSIRVPPIDLTSITPDATKPTWTLTPSQGPKNTDPPGDSLVNGWLKNGAGLDVVGKGTADAPYVLLVNGDLTVSSDVSGGEVQLPGHIRIYVSGDFTIDSDASLSAVNEPRPSLTADTTVLRQWIDDNVAGGVTLGLYVAGDVQISERTFLAATIYTQGTVVPPIGTGPRVVIGGLLARQPVAVIGNTRVYFAEPVDGVVDPGIYPAVSRRAPEGIRLVSYREWAERP